MGANIIPGRVGYTDITNFRQWCQKVLPAVYDDSLSYYEVLCKVTDYLNKVIDNNSAMLQNVTNLGEAFFQLQNYCDTYYASLDVQKEINKKLDSMASDGSLSKLMVDVVNLALNDTVNNLNQLTQKVSSLETRVSQLSRLGEGSTTGDAELIGIRTGARGEAYSDAGIAVREQFRNAFGSAMKVELNGSNTTIVLGEIIKGDGKNGDVEQGARTGYIRAYPGEVVSANVVNDVDGNSLNFYVAAYTEDSVSSAIAMGDNDGTPVYRARLAVGYGVTLPVGTKYIRISIARSTTSGIVFSESDKKYFNVSIGNLYNRMDDMFSQTMYTRISAKKTDSMDDLTHFGMYGWTAGECPYDAPVTGAGTCLVWQFSRTNDGSNGRLIQMVFAGLGMCYRFRYTTGFSDWNFASNMNTPESVKLASLCGKNMTRFVPLADHESSKESEPFKEGVECLGTPYSSVHFLSRDVYYNFNLETMFSLFNNPDSALYKWVNNTDVDSAAMYTGGVCSSFVCWATKQPIWYTTKDISIMLDYKEVACPEDVEIGDILICHTSLGDSASDHAAIVTNIIVGDNGVSGIEFAEQWHPTFRKVLLNRTNFMKLLDGTYREGNVYHVGRFPNQQLRTMPNYDVNTDIITEYGDNTYFKVGDPVYIKSAQTTINVLTPSDGLLSINLLDCPVKSGKVKMYDISKHLNMVGRWTLFGENGEKSHITTYVPGVFAVNGNKFTLNGYQGCTPVGYCTVVVRDDGVGNYDPHLGNNEYTATRLTIASKEDHKYADGMTGNSVTIDTSDFENDYLGYYVRFFLETGCGQAFIDSPVVTLSRPSIE